MLIRSFQQAEAGAVSISHGLSSAVRVLVREHGPGFSLSEARCGAGNRSRLWYKNHWEANYVRAGRGELVNRDSGEARPLHPGVLYCVGPDDRHGIHNSDDPLRIISIFNPPITGDETHDEDGAYPPTGPIPPGPGGMLCISEDAPELSVRTHKLKDGALRIMRLLGREHGMGFSLDSVRLDEGLRLDCRHPHHWQAGVVLCGRITLTDANTQTRHELAAGGVYCTGPRDRWEVIAHADSHLLAVFNPPLPAREIPDEHGAYAPGGPPPPGPA